MKKFKKVLNLPFLLLASFVAFLVYKQNPSVADSIITIALSGLYGWQMWWELQEQPDYSDEICKLRKDVGIELKKVQSDVGRISIANRGFEPGRKISF